MFIKMKNVVMLIVSSVFLVGALSLALAPSVYAMTPSTAPASTTSSENAAANQICQGASQADGSSGCDSTGTGVKVNTLINTIVNLLSWVIGVIAVIMIIFGGFKFVTSAGDSGKVTSARSTIIYALIGLVIVALAQTLVKFVLGQFIK
jgi:hypothetical protein